MDLWVVQLTISWSCLLQETIQSMTSYAQTLTLVLKHTGVNHTGSQTRIRFTFDLELSFFEASVQFLFEASVQFLFEEFKQPQHKCLLYPRFGHAVIQAFELFWFWLLCFSFWFGTFVLDFVFFRFLFLCQIKFMIWTCYFYMFLWFFQFWFCIFYYFYDIRFNGDTFQ